MEVNLDKKDLVNLVISTSPSYEEMESPKVKPLGRYCGGFVEEWHWYTRNLHEMTEGELWSLYQSLKK